MRDTSEIVALRATLQYVVSSDIPAEHKRILLDATMHAIRAATDAAALEATQQADAAQWREHETQVIATSLVGKIANSWQQADEVLTLLSSKLHRRPADVRRQATEMGFGIAVDFALAKAHRAAAADLDSRDERSSGR